MVAGFRWWVPLGAVFLACGPKVAAVPPTEEPLPRAEAAPVLTPSGAPNSSATSASSSDPTASPAPAPSTAASAPMMGTLNAEPEKKKPTGRLPPQVIQMIVREKYETFRKCYEAGLGRNPARIRPRTPLASARLAPPAAP